MQQRHPSLSSEQEKRFRQLGQGSVHENAGPEYRDPVDIVVDPSLQVFERHNSDYEVSAGFGSLTSRKGSTKPWCQSVNLGIDEQSNVAPALRLENRGGLNISKKGCEGSPWGDSRSPPFSNTQSRGNGPNVKGKPCGSTSSPKRTSLWGFSSVSSFRLLRGAQGHRPSGPLNSFYKSFLNLQFPGTLDMNPEDLHISIS